MKLKIFYVIHNGLTVSSQKTEEGDQVQTYYHEQVFQRNNRNLTYEFLTIVKSTLDWTWWCNNESKMKQFISSVKYDLDALRRYNSKDTEEFISKLKWITCTLKSTRSLYFCLKVMKSIGLEYFKEEVEHLYLKKIGLEPVLNHQ